ncbi:hypothetical protein L7F22_062888 [Adiantum nelumboides]|nr:hypothetical protein [Adiantum nelumboides]
MENWSSNGWIESVDKNKQIFCNRSLNMKSIIAVGFDMDYTLAQYKSETFETMAYHGTIKKLVYDLGYPTELLEWIFDWQYMVRGLVLDKRRGNILKGLGNWLLSLSSWREGCHSKSLCYRRLWNGRSILNFHSSSIHSLFASLPLVQWHELLFLLRFNVSHYTFS